MTNKETILKQKDEINKQISLIQEEISELNICVWEPVPEPTSPMRSSVENSPAMYPGRHKDKDPPEIQTLDSIDCEGASLPDDKNSRASSAASEHIKALEKQLAIEKKVEKGAKNIIEMYKENTVSKKLYKNDEMRQRAEIMLSEAQAKINIINIKLIQTKRLKSRDQNNNNSL